MPPVTEQPLASPAVGIAAIFVIVLGIIVFSLYSQDSEQAEITAGTDAECATLYMQNIDAAAMNLSADGSRIEKGLYYSPTLGYCVGLLVAQKETVTNVFTFNAATGDMLNPEDNAVALQEYSSR
jgi:uncharacterized membrane protein YukC